MKVIRGLFTAAVASALLVGSVVANAQSFTTGSYYAGNLGNNYDPPSGFDIFSLTGLTGLVSTGSPVTIGSFAFTAGANCNLPCTNTSGTTSTFDMTINGETHAILFPWSLNLNTGAQFDTLTANAAAPVTFNAGGNHWTVTGLALGALQSGGSAVTGNVMANFEVAAVPEPETFAMLLAGLGLIGTIGRRRSIAAANA